MPSHYEDMSEEGPRKGFLPRPPVTNMTDFVVFAFVSIVALILLTVGIGSVVWVFVSPQADISSILVALADIVTAMISALVGFLAGRGQGRAEASQQELDQMRTKRDPEGL